MDILSYKLGQNSIEPDKPDQDKTATPSTQQQIIRADAGYELASVTISPVTSNIDSNIKPENIKKDISILDTIGTYEAINPEIYKVNSISEMDSLTEMKENDICLVNGDLPYINLDYIASSGTQYIDINYKPYKTTTEIKFEYISHDNENVLCGAYSANDNRYYAFEYIDGLFKIPNRQNNIVYSEEFNTNVHTLIYNDSNNKVIYDGVEVGSVSNLTTTGTYSLYLLARHGSGGAEVKTSAKIYYVKIYENGTLVRDMVPVKRKSDNVLGMYDKLNYTFYANNGSGTFIKGNEIPAYEVYEYNGTNWVAV